MCYSLLNGYYIIRKEDFLAIRDKGGKKNNKTGFSDPVPDFIQKECQGCRANLTENVMRPFIMDLITFIGKFLTLLQL